MRKLTRGVLLAGCTIAISGAYWEGNQHLTRADQLTITQHFNADKRVVKQRPYLLSIYDSKQKVTYDYAYATRRAQLDGLVHALDAQKHQRTFDAKVNGKVVPGQIVNQTTIIQNDKNPEQPTTLTHTKKLPFNFNQHRHVKITTSELSYKNYKRDYKAPKAKHKRQQRKEVTKHESQSSQSTQTKRTHSTQSSSAAVSSSQSVVSQSSTPTTNRPVLQRKTIYVRRPIN